MLLMFDQVAEGVFRRRYQSLDLNVGVVIGDDAVLVVDTRASHAQAAELRDELRQLSKKPVGWVVNTHWHWDHTFGNSRFPEAELWGHDLTRKVLTERGEEMKVGAKQWLPATYHSVIDEVEIVAPTRTFSERASIRIGRNVDLSYYGLAHTDADITITVTDASVAFMGDLIEESAPPNFGDSYPREWYETLGRIVPDLPDVLIPGHGDVVDKSFVINQANELEAVANLVDRIDSGEIETSSACELGPYPTEVMESAFDRAASLL
jgi:glyoxylase-like metal-dependent hydrolase (beta-lactamase superfamily II)